MVNLTLPQIRAINDLSREADMAFRVETSNLPRTIAVVEISPVDDKPYPDPRTALIGPMGEVVKLSGWTA